MPKRRDTCKALKVSRDHLQMSFLERCNLTDWITKLVLSCVFVRSLVTYLPSANNNILIRQVIVHSVGTHICYSFNLSCYLSFCRNIHALWFQLVEQ